MNNTETISCWRLALALAGSEWLPTPESLSRLMDDMKASMYFVVYSF